MWVSSSRRADRRRRTAAVAVVVALAGLGTLAAGCAGDGSATHVLTVDAASSLSTAFPAIGRQFEAAHPGWRVRFNFAGSDQLAAQITEGAPVDVFAPANPATMDLVTRRGDGLGAPRTFARNRLAIAVPPSNPAHITTLADTTRPGVTLLLCAAAVPCGAAAQRAYSLAGLTPRPASLEQQVTSVVAKIELGEADAGLVYVTDVRAARGKVTGISFPQARRVVSTYPIVTVRGSSHSSQARAFVDQVLSAAGQGALRAAGFMPP